MERHWTRASGFKEEPTLVSPSTNTPSEFASFPRESFRKLEDPVDAFSCRFDQFAQLRIADSKRISEELGLRDHRLQVQELRIQELESKFAGLTSKSPR
jgi:hypothetical protein